MSEIFKPRDEKEIVEAVAWAVSGGKTLEVIGRGSKRAIGRAAQTDSTLDVSALNGVSLYEPEELVFSAQGGTPMAEIEKLLADNRQEFAFEPMDTGPILGGKPGEGTLGGMLSINFSGPRRIKAGASRDHALGVKAVSGRGEAFKAGGRVVKNVTGYDLPKLMAGSWGTLAVMTEITLKVLPVAEDVETVLALGLSDARAVEAMSAAMGSACDVSAAAHLPQKIAARLPVKSVAGGNASVTALRLEGIAPSIAYRREKLEAMLKPLGAVAVLKADESRALWRAVRDAIPFSEKTTNALWRISVTPSAGAKIGGAISAATDAEVFYDWAGGLLWVEMRDEDPHENIVRGAVGFEGHALLVRATPSVRASAVVFGSLEPGLAKVMRGVKESFDPKAVLNPGRMYAGL
jgi:glycolate oxidase FAD binding subunit